MLSVVCKSQYYLTVVWTVSLLLLLYNTVVQNLRCAYDLKCQCTMTSHPDMQADESDFDLYSDMDIEPLPRHTIPQRTASDLELQVQDLRMETERLQECDSQAPWNTPLRTRVNFSTVSVDATLDTVASLSAVQADLSESHLSKQNTSVGGSTCEPCRQRSLHP